MSMLSCLTVFFQKLFFPSNAKIDGKCEKCGSCCKRILIYDGDNLIMDDVVFINLQKQYKFYQNLHISGKNDTGELYFSCSLLKNNLCSIYPKRPNICRKYPSLKMLKLGGGLHHECSYKIKPRKSFKYFYNLYK